MIDYVLESKAMMVLRFMGYMYSVEPVMNSRTINPFALSDGWNGSQNAYTALFGHKLDAGVHNPRPLYGPCPQHAICDVVNPAHKIILIKFSQINYLWKLLSIHWLWSMVINWSHWNNLHSCGNKCSRSLFRVSTHLIGQSWLLPTLFNWNKCRVTFFLGAC